MLFMALREDKMGQTWLIPPAIGDFISDDHPCFFVVSLVDELDFGNVENKYRGTRGKPAYPRQMLLRLVIMASLDGIFSSRKIAKLAQENVVYIYLTGGETPDFRTICSFKIEYQDLIKEAFTMTVKIAKRTGMVNLGHLAVDGTKIKANASTQKNTLTQKELETIQKIIKKGIEVDEEEDKLYGDKRGDEIPDELQSRKRVRELVKEIRDEDGKKMNKTARTLIEDHICGGDEKKKQIEGKINKASIELQKSGQNAVSLTDPESRFMKNKKGKTEFAYNFQATVDTVSGLIIGGSVVQDPTDHYQLKPQISCVEENLGTLLPGTKISGDNGYFNGDNLRYLNLRGFDGYIPDKKIG